MRWILDACTFIYLVKAKKCSQFMQLVKYPVVIDSNVYQEVVVEGKKLKYPDASEAKKILNNFKIPVISIDVSKEVSRFIDPGETSCYILAKEEGICVTNDDRAYKKFLCENLKVMRLDSFFFNKFNQDYITKFEFIKILKELEKVNATKPKSILFFMEKIQKRCEEKND
ncbi:MAG: hypothetical protein EU549_04015 [Promethearchaeota archaeon]|nr:MAG: hypothetical protein EU549_04015 [Candidatus Lokiarchaeota archaeon]